MTTDSPADAWRRARDAFLDLADLEADAQRAALARLRAEDPALADAVAELLAHDPGVEPPPAPLRFGPYVAVRLLGVGGMGEVHLARRADGEFEREVAVKLLHPGAVAPEFVARFLRERQTLAALEHESIVRLLDGGTTEEGRPYLVMEYVDGAPLDAYVRAQDLPLRERLELFRRVVAAVAHAHSRGIVHRDLKPSNVLVRPDGAVRLVDFGIARALGTDLLPAPAEDLTRTGQRFFTPEYASPEQVRGDRVTAATDVFALGVILYELLAGASPWRRHGSTHDLEREVVDANPPPPSRRGGGTVARAARGDLDTITLKCLAREPAQRYANAAALAEDLDRHLGGRTILARRATALERGVRLVRRRPWHALAAVATGLLCVAIVGAASARRAERARQAQVAEAVPGRLDAARRLLSEGERARGRRELETALAEIASLDDPGALVAYGLAAQATFALEEGDDEGALVHIAAARASPPPGMELGPGLVAELGYHEANALAALGRYDEAEGAARAVLSAVREQLDPTSELALGPAVVLARLLVHTQRAAEALEVLAPAREAALGRDREHDELLAQIDGLMGRAHLELGRPEDAVRSLEAALSALRWRSGEGHKDVAEFAVYLGQAYLQVGRIDEGWTQLASAQRAYRVVENVRMRAMALGLLYQVALARGEVDVMVEIARENAANLAGGGDEVRAQWCWVQYELGSALLQRNDREAARAALEAALGEGECAPPVGPTVADVSPFHEALARASYGDVLVALDEPEAGRAQRERALGLFRAADAEEHPTARSLRQLLGR